ncbi:Ig-like domain repeat protein [uncultured Methanobrevibacter sp.]|uniref:Ig-like domain repeat protein n=1 Tax=uncultured Methanobrevibacter sp. TaxID=253161 RepID=UPI0025F52C12|nr:Ig-like domain repeat protein [uncultured Methanobrevibacter sp.]
MNGKTYKAKTNANGVASVNVSISKAGSYAVTAKYAGDSTFAATTAKATLNIS